MGLHCPACGCRLQLVQVHGHGQCAWCATNVEPCCGGAGDEADEVTGPEIEVDPALFRRLFEHLGGPLATVTEDALTHAFCQRQGSTLDEAREIFAVAQRVGALRTAGPGLYRLP